LNIPHIVEFFLGKVISNHSLIFFRDDDVRVIKELMEIHGISLFIGQIEGNLHRVSQDGIDFHKVFFIALW